jgi:hypothetical protein
MTTLTEFREDIAQKYGKNALHQALQGNKTGSALAFKSEEQKYRDSGLDEIVSPGLLDAVTAIVAAHVAQQAVQAEVVAQPASIAQGRASICSRNQVLVAALGVIAAVTSLYALNR